MSMSIPEGYVSIGLIGFSDKGDYDPKKIYMENDLTHSNNTVWRCKVNDTIGVAPIEGLVWTVWVQSPKDLVGVTAIDQDGMLGAAGQVVVAQNLMNAITAKIANDVAMKMDIINQIINDPDKMASIATVYSLLQMIGNTALLPGGAKDLVSAFNVLNSEMTAAKAEIKSKIIIGSQISLETTNTSNNLHTFSLPAGVSGKTHSILSVNLSSVNKTWSFNIDHFSPKIIEDMLRVDFMASVPQVYYFIPIYVAK